MRRGRKLAEEYDDSLYKYTNLLFLGDFLYAHNVQEGIEQFEELYELTQELEVPYYMGEVLNDTSLAFETAGEYDLAISCHLEVIKIRGSKDFTSQLLSRIYASLGDASRALEEANYFLEYTAGIEILTGYLRKARALALLNRIDEAEQLLDKANAIIMKSGSDVVLGTYYHVAGVIELAKGDYLDALEILEKSWEVYEKLRRIHCQNYVLLDLARAEFLCAKESEECIDLTLPRRWLSQLERQASNLNLPGIKMQAAMLKSEFYQENNQLKDAQAVLEDALKIFDSAGVLTLKKMISARIKELDQLMHDAEIA